MHMYKKGWELGKDKLGDSHALTLSLKRSLMNLSQDNYSTDAIPNGKSSKASVRKPRTSSTRFSQRKSPLSLPSSYKRDSFPTIHDPLPLKENISNVIYSEKNKRVRNTMHSADRYKATAFINKPPKRQIQTINKKKYEALKDLIDELEGNIPSSGLTEFEPIISSGLSNFKQKGNLDDKMKNTSIGIQVEFVDTKKIEEKPIHGLHKGWRKYRKPKGNKKENIEIKMKEAEIKVKEAINEVDRLIKENNEKKELIPIPNKTKVEFFKRKQLQTIYESRYEDQLEPVILIQSHIKAWLERKKYQKIKKATERIQTYVKMYLTRALYKSIISAAVFIQAVYRGHRVRKLYNFLLNPY